MAITSSSLTESPISFDHESRTAVVMESPRDSSGSTTTDDEAVGISSVGIVRNMTSVHDEFDYHNVEICSSLLPNDLRESLLLL